MLFALEYITGMKISSFKLTCNLFGILPVVDSTNGIIQAILFPHSHMIFCILLVLLGDGAVKSVSVMNCYIY